LTKSFEITIDEPFFDGQTLGKLCFARGNLKKVVFLFLQALLFYLPRKLWKSFEGGLMESFGKAQKAHWCKNFWLLSLFELKLPCCKALTL
jgi:hypothetical protein